MVLVPRIVPHKYVSTTLGAHKAVSAANPLLRRTTHRSTQLEQTGSTIFQTVAGLVLDVKSGKHDKLAPGQGDPKDVQYLLNAFVILNILEVLAVVALSRLDRKQKEEASRRMSALLPQTIDESDEEGAQPVKGSPRSQDNWVAEEDDSGEPVTSNRRGSHLSAHRARASSSSTREQSIPLLGNGSRHSTMRGSRYIVDAVLPDAFEDSPSPIKGKVLRTKSEVRRGEVFAVLSGLLILSAWALFMGTAYLRLRSKSERGGGSGNSTAFP